MKARSAPGRPRNPSTDEAIFEATVKLLVSKGLDATSIDAVARLSGVSRPTIYRRYRNRNDLIEACVERILSVQLAAPRTTGDARQDVIALLLNTIELLVETPFGEMFRTLIPHLPRYPRFGKLANNIGTRRRQVFKSALEKAQQQGVIGGEKDLDAVADGILGAIYFRFLVTRRKLDKAYVEHLLAELGPGSDLPSSSGRR